MPYVKFLLGEASGQKAYKFLLDHGYDMQKSQAIIDKKRLICADRLVSNKSEILRGEVAFIDYKCRPKGLKPLYENDKFSVFDKPNGVLSHPNGRNCEYSLYDEIWHLYGKNACVAHRLDKETSGLIIVAKDKNSANELKVLFENRAVQKSYIALVRGAVQGEFEADLPMCRGDEIIKIRQIISPNGKASFTKFERLEYFEKLNFSLVKATPLTGRQHQIRVHLHALGHTILGDTLYGVSDKVADDYLNKNLSSNERFIATGANRLCLHASEIEFDFGGKNYHFVSQIDIKKDFLNAVKSEI